jgi:hypothetical protein
MGLITEAEERAWEDIKGKTIVSPGGKKKSTLKDHHRIIKIIKGKK